MKIQVEAADLINLVENNGYAIATIEAFMKPPGIGGEQVQEAITRLTCNSEIIAEIQDRRNEPNEYSGDKK